MFINFASSLLRRLARNPEINAAVDEGIEGLTSVFRNAPESIASSYRNYIPGVESFTKWLKEDIPAFKRTLRSMIDEVRSPQYVFERYGEPGQKMWEVPTRAYLDMNKWKHSILEPFERLAAKVDEEGSTRVFRALENPAEVIGLNKHEKALHDFLKTQYDFLWKTHIRHVAGSDENYNKIMRMTMREVSPEELDALPPFMQEAYRMAKATIKDYAPHLWKREDLLDMLQRRMTELVSKYETTQDPVTKKNLLATIREYEKATTSLSGGQPLAFDIIPKDILFRHGLLRKGALGYQEDAIRTFRSYVHSMAEKRFLEPALQEMAMYYNQLPFEIRPYAKWFIRDIAGYNHKSPWDKLAANISSFEYMRTLGWNLRSPIVNLTQQINTFADAGPYWSIQGYRRLFSKDFKELWEKTGLGIEVPHVLTDELHPNAGKIEKAKRVLGFFFNLAEEANRKHAFATYLTKAEAKYGKGDPRAIEEAIKGVYKTQFQYGIVGMPKVLRGPVGRIALQFWSYPIKQAEFLHRLAKENPLKLVYYMGATVGGNEALERYLGMDLSNALGFGITLGEAINMLASLSKGELDEAIAHGKLTFAQGSGILPSGPGPALTSLINIARATMRGEPLEQIVKELTPVQWQRVEDLLAAIKNRHVAEKGKLPVGKRDPLTGEMTEVMFEQPAWRSVLEVVGPRGAERARKTEEWYKQRTMDELEGKRKRIIAEAIAAGDAEKATKLIDRWQVVPTRDSIYEAMLRQNLPRELRKKFVKAEQRQAVREEEMLSTRLRKMMFGED